MEPFGTLTCVLQQDDLDRREPDLTVLTTSEESYAQPLGSCHPPARTDCIRGLDLGYHFSAPKPQSLRFGKREDHKSANEASYYPPESQLYSAVSTSVRRTWPTVTT